MSAIERRRLRLRRKKKTRKQLQAAARPQLLVYRSGKHIYAQLVDSATGRTLTGASTRTPEVRAGLETTKDVEAAKRVGAQIAKVALSRDIHEVTFNRNGFVYAGRVKALADGAREAGLRF
jgi:large subunit ribosomal protein L18